MAEEDTEFEMLATGRISLRPWRRADTDAFRRLATDPRVVRYISNGIPFDDDRIEEFIERQIRQQRDLGFSMWRVVFIQTGETIGLCGMQPLGTTGEIEIGWWIAPEHWGRGLASEAARAVLQHGLETARLQRVVAIAHPENGASRRIMEKLGMVYEALTEHRGIPVVRYAVSGLPGAPL